MDMLHFTPTILQAGMHSLAAILSQVTDDARHCKYGPEKQSLWNDLNPFGQVAAKDAA